MALRYWVGGSGIWGASNTANWSATSGGAGGAVAPVGVQAPVDQRFSAQNAGQYRFVNAGE